jgi:hypothetical protein
MIKTKETYAAGAGCARGTILRLRVGNVLAVDCRPGRGSTVRSPKTAVAKPAVYGVASSPCGIFKGCREKRESREVSRTRDVRHLYYILEIKSHFGAGPLFAAREAKTKTTE